MKRYKLEIDGVIKDADVCDEINSALGHIDNFILAMDEICSSQFEGDLDTVDEIRDLAAKFAVQVYKACGEDVTPDMVLEQARDGSDW